MNTAKGTGTSETQPQKCGLCFGSPSNPCGNLDELWERVEEQRYAIPQEVCTNLIKSMPKQTAALLSTKKLRTKY